MSQNRISKKLTRKTKELDHEKLVTVILVPLSERHGELLVTVILVGPLSERHVEHSFGIICGTSGSFRGAKTVFGV
jgi:hypothetical protein